MSDKPSYIEYEPTGEELVIISNWSNERVELIKMRDKLGLPIVKNE